MKNIEIITAQNVVLQYELAGLKERVFAFIIDLMILLTSITFLSGIGGAILSFSSTGVMIWSILVWCIFFFYSLAFEYWNQGRSLGKMALKIQVIKVAGGRATFSDYAARWVFRMVDIWFSFGAIASILVVSSAKGQRIGDVVANTAVVKVVPKMNLTLNDILAIHRQNNYVPQYMSARKLQEEDALLIKAALERYRKFRNPAHEEALDLLMLRVRKILDLEHVQGDPIRFLQTVLQDYVILTR